MYSWGNVTFPTSGLIDQQVYVDDHKKIFIYDSAAHSWKAYNDAYIKLVKTFNIFVDGQLASINPLDRIPELQGIVGTYWDSVYQFQFVEVTFTHDNSKQRRYGMGYADYPAFCTTYYPQSGGRFLGHMIIDIYTVFDPKLNITKVAGHNSIYGSARGRNGYFRHYKRPLSSGSGLDSGFHSAKWSSPLNNFGMTLMSAFFGITPVSTTNNEDAIWFSQGKRSLYQQPRVSSLLDSLVYRKYSYEVSSNSFTLGPLERYTIGVPKALIMSFYDMGRGIYEMSALHGDTFLWNQNSVVLIYPLVNDTGTRIAFLMKPFGIDYIDFQVLQDASLTFYSETYFKGSNRAYITTLDTPEDSSTFSFIYKAHLTLRYVRSQVGANTTTTPEFVRFFRKNNINGVESERSPFELKIYRNKNNATIYFGINKKM